MSQIRKNLYIEILKYGEQKVEFTAEDLFSDLNFNQEEKTLFHNNLAGDKSLINNVRINTDNKLILTISIEGRFKLLEYEELEDARESSKSAKYLSWIAIGISGILAILSILIQAFGSIRLNERQYNRLLHSLHSSYGRDEVIIIKTIDRG